MNPTLPRPPANLANHALRQQLYEGALFQLPPTPASLDLCAQVSALLLSELGESPRQAQFRLSPEEFFARIGRLRKVLFTDPRFHEATRAVITSCGFEGADTAFDALRLRVIAHRGFEDPRAAPVYYPHRDTWYGHPQCLISWWIALHDASEEETFVFYPDRFRSPVPNGSAEFDYDEWVQKGWDLKIGWQDREAGRTARYPNVIGEVPPSREVPFSARAGEIVLFSGAHFHRTRNNLSGQTRFSLDFRTASLADHERGLGAPNVDNRSRGSALRDYVQPRSKG